MQYSLLLVKKDVAYVAVTTGRTVSLDLHRQKYYVQRRTSAVGTILYCREKNVRDYIDYCVHICCAMVHYSTFRSSV